MEMKSVVITKVYEVRASAKGWSDSIAFYFNKDRALAYAENCKRVADAKGYKRNFRVYEHSTFDAIVYSEPK